jgi:YHS domain-containing protein
MKNSNLIVGMILTVALAAFAPSSHADGTNAVSSVKPDLLKTCPVSGDKLGADMGKPYVFVYQGQEVKLCCPDCKADFDKNPAKYLKKIQDAAAKAKN